MLDFDKTGLLNKQTILDSSGKKVNEYFFIYNRQADQVERKNIDYQLNKTFTARFDKTYNEALLIKESSSEFPYSTEHRYNSKKQRIESVSILGADSTTAAKSIKLFKYEEDGRLIGTEVLYKQIGQEATTMEKCTYLYNAEGKVITIKRDNSPDYQFSYNKNGLLNSTRVKMPEDLSSLEILDKYSYSFWE